MNIPILIAAILTLLAFFIHALSGDKDLHFFYPAGDTDPTFHKLEKWTTIRCGWHWISVDLLMAAIFLFLMLFSEIVQDKIFFMRLLSIYFLAYGLIFLLVITLTKSFPNNYLKIGQWLLMLLLSGIIYWGSIF